jgi:hypothetical protein
MWLFLENKIKYCGFGLKAMKPLLINFMLKCESCAIGSDSFIEKFHSVTATEIP